MATIFLRLEHKTGDENLTERFLIDCTSRQEALLRRANRKISSKDKLALFVTLLCTIHPSGETLQIRKRQIQNALSVLKDEAQGKDNNLNLTNIIGANTFINSFFTSPYGIFKVLRSPLSMLDPTADFRVSSVVMTNDIDLGLLNSLRLEE